MSWSRTVAEAAARPDPAEVVTPRAATATTTVSWDAAAAVTRARHARLAAIGTFTSDHEEETSGGYDHEDGFEEDAATPAADHAEDEDDAAYELNANIAQVRRAGDHSDW